MSKGLSKIKQQPFEKAKCYICRKSDFLMITKDAELQAKLGIVVTLEMKCNSCDAYYMIAYKTDVRPKVTVYDNSGPGPNLYGGF